MAVYQVSGGITSLDNDYGTANITVSDSQNSITGSAGVTVIKMTNTDANVTTIGYTPFSTVYPYTDRTGVSLTGGGNGATFNVDVSRDGYINITVGSYGGQDYGHGEQIMIEGGQLGGVNGDNDLIFEITSYPGQVFPGALTSTATYAIISGVTAWPQSSVGSVKILPNQTEFVQVASGRHPDGVWLQGQGYSNLTLLQPVTIVGQ